MSSVSGLPSESELTYVPLIVFYFCEFSSIALPPLHGVPALFVRARTHTYHVIRPLLISLCVHPLCLIPPTPLLSSPLHLNSALSLLPVPSFMLTLLSFSTPGPRVPRSSSLASFHGAAFYISVLLFILKQSPSIPQLSFLSAAVSFQLKPTKLRKWAFETLISGRAPLRDKQ